MERMVVVKALPERRHVQQQGIDFERVARSAARIVPQRCRSERGVRDRGVRTGRQFQELLELCAGEGPTRVGANRLSRCKPLGDALQIIAFRAGRQFVRAAPRRAPHCLWRRAVPYGLHPTLVERPQDRHVDRSQPVAERLLRQDPVV